MGPNKHFQGRTSASRGRSAPQCTEKLRLFFRRPGLFLTCWLLFLLQRLLLGCMSLLQLLSLLLMLLLQLLRSYVVRLLLRDALVFLVLFLLELLPFLILLRVQFCLLFLVFLVQLGIPGVRRWRTLRRRNVFRMHNVGGAGGILLGTIVF